MVLDPTRKLFRWGPISACPLYMYFTIEPAFKPLKKLLGLCYPDSIVVFKDRKVTWFLDEEQFSKRSNIFTRVNIFDLVKKRFYFNLWDQRTTNLVSGFEQLDHINLSKLSDKKLKDEYTKFKQRYYDWWALTISVELVTVTIEPLLGNKLRQYYSQYQESQYNQDFAILTSPLKLTFYRREQRDLLRIYTLPMAKRESALKDHQKQYYWILNNYYQGKIISADQFADELNKITDSQYQMLSWDINSYEDRLKQQKEKILIQMDLDAKTKEIVSLVETFSTLQDDRKMYNFKAEHYLELFIGEFGKRGKVAIDDLRYFLPDELNQRQDFQSAIQSRRKCLVFECTDNGLSFYSGSEAVLISGRFFNQPDISGTMIHGMVASVGTGFHFRGIARIVRTIEEIDKVQEGDILVTTMTSPDFVIGMRKAGAIITDVGGILSHAAIISRELRKPCIVGTGIATMVIKDGDVVEIHSGKGTVKIIKSG